MPRSYLTAVLLSVAIAAAGMISTPAHACKGKTTLLKDDFSKRNRAWAPWWKSEFEIIDGKLLGKAQEGVMSAVAFGGRFFPEADVCVDVVIPQGQAAAAGLMFTSSERGQFYFAQITADGKVGLTLATPDGWLQPLPVGDFEGVNLQPGATNTIRVTWKAPPPKGSTTPEDPTVSLYINDKLVESIEVPPQSGRVVGLMWEGPANNISEFRNFWATR
jgi:hypothetical protein